MGFWKKTGKLLGFSRLNGYILKLKGNSGTAGRETSADLKVPSSVSTSTKAIDRRKCQQTNAHYKKIANLQCDHDLLISISIQTFQSSSRDLLGSRIKKWWILFLKTSQNSYVRSRIRYLLPSEVGIRKSYLRTHVPPKR
jgi:hypothetical protein